MYPLSGSFERGNFSAVPCVGLAWPASQAASSQKPVFFFFFFHCPEIPVVVCDRFDQNII